MPEIDESEPRAAAPDDTAEAPKMTPAPAEEQVGPPASVVEESAEPAPEPEPVSEPEPEPASAPAPEPAPAPAGPGAPDAAFVEGVSGGLTWIPFGVYLGLWVVLAGLSAYFLHGATPEQPARWMPEYVPLLWAGVGLVAAGPVLSLVVWLVARARRPAGARRGLFASAFTRGALVAFFGVVLWLGTLFVLELIASGWAL